MTIITRESSETRVRLSLERGTGVATVDTTLPFLDHMLATLARYSGLDLGVTARGDLPHHILEDVALACGRALTHLIPPHPARFGERTIPMDDALVHAVLDLGQRPYYRGPLPSRLYDHWMRSFATEAGMTLHLRVLRGSDRHHVIEAGFKALGLALRDALRDGDQIFSTKGVVRWQVE
jgi:imidazoleglycerol-phosphate dehydratase